MEESYSLFLNFKNDNFGLLQCTETVGFDSTKFSVKTEAESYGSQIFYANEEIPLTFFAGTFGSNLSMGFEKLVEYFKFYGFNADVEFIVYQNEVQFLIGNLDFVTATTDLITYFKCTIIQNTKIAKAKRKMDTIIDVFESGRIKTERILFEPTPIFQVSQWETPTVFGAELNSDGIWYYYNPAQNIIKSEIDDTLTFISNIERDDEVGGGDNRLANFYAIATARNDFSKIKVEITDLNYLFKYINLVSGSFSTTQFILSWGFSPLVTLGSIELFSFFSNSLTHYTNTNDYTYEIPFLPSGANIYLFFKTFKSDAFDIAQVFIYDMKVKVSANSIPLPTVLNGVRQTELIAEVCEVLNQNKLEQRGIDNNQFCFNGKLVRNIKQEPFYVNPKEVFNDLKEINFDYKITDDFTYVSSYDNFYPNNDIGAFLMPVEESFKVSFNERFAINEFNIKYKSYENNSEKSYTLDSVNTIAQYYIPNEQCENKKVIEINHIRDTFAINDVLQKSVIVDDTTSLDYDDRLFVIDCVQIAPQITKTFNRFLVHFVQSPTNLLISTNDYFNWDLLGLRVGDVFKITQGVNFGNYTINSFTENILNLELTSVQNLVGGQHYCLFEYLISGIKYKNRENEGFDLIENFRTPNEFSNLNYSIGRNVKRWLTYLTTSCLTLKDDIIKNTYFKSNGRGKTKLITELVPITENENININDLPNPVLDTLVYDMIVISDVAKVKEMLTKMNTINNDGSIGGFIRVRNSEGRIVKVFIHELSFDLNFNVIKLKGFLKYENNFLTIDSIGSSLVKINDVGYDSTILSKKWFKIENNYLFLFDKNSIPLNNKVRIDFVKVNGIIYNDAVALTDALWTIHF